MTQPTRLIALATLSLAVLPLSGCALFKGTPKSDTGYIARDVNTLYALAKKRLDGREYKRAAELFAEVERQHPYSVWARRAQLMGAYSFYMAREYQSAIDASKRFSAIHPGNKDAPYAAYLEAMSYYQQISHVSRDQKATEQAKASFSGLIRRYPQSEYAADARLKLDLINDHLAGKEMEIGRYYQKTGKWLAAALRFQNVVDQYETTNHAPEALLRMVESYLNLGIPSEAQKAAAVLGRNYPDTKWYERAYKLMSERGVPTTA